MRGMKKVTAFVIEGDGVRWTFIPSGYKDTWIRVHESPDYVTWAEYIDSCTASLLELNKEEC